MKPEIIDLVDSKETKKRSIELLQCLPKKPSDNGEYSFKKSDYYYHLKRADKITRLTKFHSNEGVFDVIETETVGIRNIFIGHWNDGYVE